MTSVRRPTLLLLDVNETLSDLGPLAARFDALGLPGLAGTWFASVLRDGFALTVVGQAPSFAELGGDALRTLLHRQGVHDPAADDAVEQVLGDFMSLGLHPDVAPGLERLGAAGLRVATLSNGSASVAEGLLRRAGIEHLVERVLSVEQAGRWKPDGRAYAYALQACGVPAEETMLVAVHPWDVDGARRAGLTGAWIDRDGSPYPASFLRPDVTATSFVDLADRLDRLPPA